MDLMAERWRMTSGEFAGRAFHRLRSDAKDSLWLNGPGFIFNVAFSQAVRLDNSAIDNPPHELRDGSVSYGSSSVGTERDCRPIHVNSTNPETTVPPPEDSAETEEEPITESQAWKDLVESVDRYCHGPNLLKPAEPSKPAGAAERSSGANRATK